MSNFWLKLKVWSKGTTIGLILLYVLVFIFKNNQQVTFWWWYNREDQHSVLLLIAISFFAGIVSTILIRTTWRTIRQLRDLRERSRGQRMERELADMKDKAGRLQTKPSTSGAADVMESPSDETIQ
jgi:uncharacterized integral membrane protein